MLDIDEQKLKLAITNKMRELWDDDDISDTTSTVCGAIPGYAIELMGEAAFNILIAIQVTNRHRDDNPA